jgi:cell wall-associated NlpC family hydrolase
VAVFAYSPTVEVYIKSLAQNTVYDVTEDMVRGQTIHRSNAPHQMQVTLMNKNRRYDALFAPNDLFAVYMKRTRRLLVMSGYLDSVPWYSTWERSVEIFGTCTVKRIVQKRWDPSTIAALNLMIKAGNTQQQLNVDGGMQAKAMALLTQVGGWPMDTVHIANLPLSWMQKITNLYNAANPVLLNQMWDSMGGSVSASGNNSPMVGSTYTPQSMPKGLTAAQSSYFSLPTSTQGGMIVAAYSGPTNLLSQKLTEKQFKSEYFCQLNWGYKAPGQKSLTQTMQNWLSSGASGPVMVFCPTTNKTVLCTPAGDGPGKYSATAPKIGLSPAALSTLGITSGTITQGVIVYIAWCDKSQNGNYYPPGPWPKLRTKTKKGTYIITSAAVTPSEGASSSTDTAVNPYSPTTESTTQGAKVVSYCENVVAKGMPYVWGGTGPPGYTGYDCSGLAWAAWNAAGVAISSGGGRETCESMYSDSRMELFSDPSKLMPGDLVFYYNNSPNDTQPSPNHMGIFIYNDSSGTPWTIQAHDVQEGITKTQMNPPYSLPIVSFGRPTGYPRFNGKATSSQAGSANMGSGAGGSASGYAGAAGGTVQQVNNNTSFLHYWEYFGQAPSPTGQILTGIRGLLNDQPLLPFLNVVLNSSMRSWCSAPNGDFIAWFPDYFGAYGTAATLRIEDIELMDFSIAWSDQNMVTHQYVAASWATSILGSSPAGTPGISNLSNTDGVVTLEMGSVSNNILQTVLNLKSGDNSGLGSPQAILNRFGARPNFQQVGILLDNQAQFWYALYLFQLNWASMFSTNMPITFMPEAYPGMLVQLRDGFQAYITQVQHAWDFTDGGPGFTTQLAIMAPSDWKGGGLFGLPQGGLTAVV